MNSLTIFQIRSGLTDPDEILIDRGELLSHPARISRRLLGVLYVKQSKPKPPAWLSYLAGAVDLSDLRIRTASAAAVLLIARGGETYAVAFGYGRWLLAEGAITPRFGLRVTLNAIEPTQIRSIDHRRLEAVPRHTREQLSKGSNLLSFGLDVERDLLRAVTGKPSDQTLGKQLSGADQLSVIGDIPIDRLEVQLARYQQIARQDTYRNNFPWVDNIREVSDSLLKNRLELALVEELKAGSLDRTWLAIPEIVEWSTLAGFQYSKGKGQVVFPDLVLGDYFHERRMREELEPQHLRSDYVHCVDAELGGTPKSWSVWRCLIAELQVGGEIYMLSEGKWYAVAADFLAQVEEAVARLEPCTLKLPKYADSCEADYNRRAAQGSGGVLHLLDRDLIQCGIRALVEPCDLYSAGRHLVHVKRYGGSSVLSHLFQQGVVSAQMLAQDRTFRQSFNAKLPTTHRLEVPDRPPTVGEFEVAYVIIVRPSGTPGLPFFSKVNLRNTAQLLRQLGYKVTLTFLQSLIPSGAPDRGQP